MLPRAVPRIMGKRGSMVSRATKLQKLYAMCVAIGLLLSVYLPAFIAMSFFRPSVQYAIPLVIGISFAISLALIIVLAQGRGISQFGFRIPQLRFVGFAAVIGVPLAITTGWLVHAFPSPSPVDTSGLPLWMLCLYFVAGASIQEEVIFRGMLQSFVEQRWMATISVFKISVSVAVVFAAAVFGVVHLGSGLAVFAGAIVLGLVAGEL